MLGEGLPQNKGALYLQNTACVHYDVVLQVCTDVTDISNTCCKYSSIKSPINSNGDKQKHTSTCNEQTSKLLNKSKIHIQAENSLITKLNHNVHKKDENFGTNHSSSSSNRFKMCLENSDNSCKSNHSSEIKHDNNLDSSSNVDINAKQHISNFQKSVQFTVYQCQTCHEAWPLKSEPKSPTTYVCQRCKADKGTPKTFSAGNDIIPTAVPKDLQGLTQIEEMLISRALPIMKVYVKPGGQHGYSGHCINLPQKVTELAQSLPRYPKNIPLIMVTMNGKNNNFKDVIVRRNKVEKALSWLMKNNRHYEKILFDSDSLNSLPTNSIPDDLQTIETVLADEYDDHVSNDSDIEDEELFDTETETSSFLPQNEMVNLKMMQFKMKLRQT